MSRFSSFAEKARFWFVVVAVTSVTLYVMLKGGWLLLKSTSCSDEVLHKVSRIAGHDFEARVLDCRFTSDTTIFISRPGGGKRTPLLLYTRVEYPLATPVFREIDEHTVQILLSNVGRVICLQDRWGKLRIKYDIGWIEDPRLDDHVPECLR